MVTPSYRKFQDFTRQNAVPADDDLVLLYDHSANLVVTVPYSYIKAVAGGGGGGTDYAIEYNRVALTGSYTYVTGSLSVADQPGEVAYQLGSPARYKIVGANATDAALLRFWAKTGAKLVVGAHVLTLSLAYAESPTGTFTLTGALSGTAPSAGAVDVHFGDVFALAAAGLTPAQLAKLNGIAAGAQVNPRHVSEPFRTEDGANANLPGVIEFIKSDNSQWQGGSSSEVAAVEINPAQYDLTQNPAIDTAAYTGWHSLPDDLVQNNGSSIWTFQRIADASPFAPLAGQVFRVQVESVSKNTDGNYVLSMLTHLEGFSFPTGTGYNWQVVSVYSPPSGADSVIGVLGKPQLPSDVVYTAQLQGSETDLFASYNNALVQNTYRAGDWVLTTDTAGPPTQANQVRQPDIATGSGLFVIGRLRTDADPNDLQWSDVPAASQLVSGDIWYASIDGDKGSHLAITLTSGGTLVSTGTAAYVWATATWVETGNIADVSAYGDYFRLGKRAPTQLQIEIPYTDILGAPWVEPGGVATDITNTSEVLVKTASGWRVAGLDHFSEHTRPITTAPRKIAVTWETSLAAIDAGNLKVGIQNALQNGIMQLKLSLPDSVPLVGGGTLPIADVEAILNLHHKLTLTGASPAVTITGAITGFLTSFGERYINLEDASVSATPTDGQALTMTLESNLVERGELKPVAFTGDYADLTGKPTITKFVNSDIGTTAEAIAKNLDGDDFLSITIQGTIDGNLLTRSVAYRYGDMDATERIVLGAAGYNQQVILTKSGTTLNAKRGGGATAADSIVYVERRIYTTGSLA